jgi:hypothetical protein
MSWRYVVSKSCNMDGVFAKEFTLKKYPAAKYEQKQRANTITSSTVFAFSLYTV